MTNTLTDRFWGKVKKGRGLSCWMWTGSVATDGYGVFTVRKNHQIRAHRLAYELGLCESPGKMLVCHKCDNPLCVNPKHLFLGTNSDNMKDCFLKGRLPFADLHRKLNRQQVAAIRKSHPRISSYKLGRKYGVSRTTVMRIVRNIIWKK